MGTSTKRLVLTLCIVLWTRHAVIVVLRPDAQALKVRDQAHSAMSLGFR